MIKLLNESFFGCCPCRTNQLVELIQVFLAAQFLEWGFNGYKYGRFFGFGRFVQLFSHLQGKINGRFGKYRCLGQI